MSSSSEKKNFFATHYDWLIAGVGVLAALAGLLVLAVSLGTDPDDAADEAKANVARMKPAKTGVEALDLAAYQSAVKVTRSPALINELPEKGENFLASERRVICKGCKKVISGDVKKTPECPYCHVPQEVEQVLVVDADGDGLPDEWEKKYGLNMNDPSDANADPDGDGFTNLEEFAAKTNPKDPKDHPDYLDSLAIQPPLKQTFMPFVFTKATQIPAGWRCEFYDAKTRNDYGRLGLTMSAMLGEEIGASGFVLKSFEKKETKVPIEGGEGMMRTKDVSEVLLQRKRDGKQIRMVFSERNSEAPMPVDVQATLLYERGAVKTFEVVKGSEVDLSGNRYVVVDIAETNQRIKVTLRNPLTGKQRTLEALES